MSDRALELFEQYLDQRASGQQPDAAALVHEAGDQADVLAGMIAAYAATHPADVTEHQLEQMVARPELEPPRPWPELLPALRERTHITRAALVSRLCEALGVAGSERQVGDYVHELEAGLLSPARVRPAVVSALAVGAGRAARAAGILPRPGRRAAALGRAHLRPLRRPCRARPDAHRRARAGRRSARR